MAAKLLRLPLAWVAHKQQAVVLHELVLDFPLRGLIDILLVKRHDPSCNRLSNRVDL
jgi:hypothetical protein